MKLIVNVFIVLFCCLIQAQQIDVVDFKTAKANIKFGDLAKNEVEGIVSYEFDILNDTDSIFMDSRSMTFSKISLFKIGVHADAQLANVKFNNNSERLVIYNKFKKGEIYSATLDYSVQPKKALYFIENDEDIQIWTQGQGKYTSNWLPSIDDMNEKIEFDLTITFNKDYEVIANGKLTNKQINALTTTWHFDMQNPMSSYLVALAIGKYDKKAEISKSGIPLEMYYYPSDSLKFEPTYRYTKQIFDFLEEEIGVPYPWQNYKQVPVKDFLYAGMENTSATIFSDTYLIDYISFIDKNYVNVNAHELAHQWFGDLVTETSGTHHWLQEGFATYYTLLTEKELFGEDYYYWQLYEYFQELVEQEKAGGNTALLDPKSSSTTFYKKGALVLYMLREKVGDKAFKEAIKNYLLKHQFKNVETSDFITEVEKASEQDLTAFVKIWLESEMFDSDSVIEHLKQSKFIDDYLKMDSKGNQSKYADYMASKISDEAKIKLISENSNFIRDEDFNNGLKVRQAIAKSLSEIPSELKTNYETLLNDESYTTIEVALYHLWNNFPEDRNKYLDKTKSIQGFNDKNIRALWLTLALVTDGFETENKSIYFEELTNYTNPIYHFEVRMNAFQYLKSINACNEKCKENLEQATKSPVWQFSKMAKDLLKN